jgi:hypothetical protein
MSGRILSALFLAALVFFLLSSPHPAPACCPAPPSGKPVLNADQTVIILWDEATKTEHFIRRASFKAEADDFGFLVPTPSQPELSESGDTAFPALQKLTEPEVKRMSMPSAPVGCGCAGAKPAAKSASAPPAVRVLQEKDVAGYKAVVLEADSAEDLVKWLKDNGYAFSPEVQAWARPYVEGKWKITALKVAKPKEDEKQKNVSAAALRMSFKTDRPLFPYREPDPEGSVKTLGVDKRLLRIYFLAEARYQGSLKGISWTGFAAWAGKVNADDRKKVLDLLKLPEKTGPADWWLTEFEDDWPYRVAPSDLYFARNANQSEVRRPPIIEYVSSFWPADAMVYALGMVMMIPLLSRRFRRG